MRRSISPRLVRGLLVTFLATAFTYFLYHKSYSSGPRFHIQPLFPEQYPVETQYRIPHGRPKRLPKVQAAPIIETPAAKKLRESRLTEVRDEFIHAWTGYKAEAWAKDELRPISGGFKTPFCGWAATMIDSLDILFLMGLDKEFALSLEELANVDFTNTEGCQINLFETTIRHLGGLLAAYDVSGQKHMILLEKAVEIAEILYSSFDTPNRMPIPHYTWDKNKTMSDNPSPGGSLVLAVLGSLSVEFTRLSQITGDHKYYDGIQRVMDELEKWQMETTLPGMWPAMVSTANYNVSVYLSSTSPNDQYTLGALADSTYEYLPKEYILLGGLAPQYKTMYENFIPVAKKNLFFRPMTLDNRDILISGTLTMSNGGSSQFVPDLQHLTCFSGGFLALAGKIFDRPEDVEDGIRLTNGCVWAYQNTITGIMPESFLAVPCENSIDCTWDEKTWWDAVDPFSGSEEEARQIILKNRLSPGFAKVTDSRYLLRPEAIESVFIAYRITGDPHYQKVGWSMFESIRAHTRTKIAHSAIDDVTSGSPKKVDEMESFWLAETLKYFYLLFEDVGVVSLDEYVLNTEAHPLRRPI